MHEVELTRAVMTPTVVEDVGYALQDAGVPLESQDSRSMKRVFEIIISATLRQLGIRVTPEGQLEMPQPAAGSLRVQIAQLADALPADPAADDAAARALGRRASGKSSAKLSKKARTK